MLYLAEAQFTSCENKREKGKIIPSGNVVMQQNTRVLRKINNCLFYVCVLCVGECVLGLVLNDKKWERGSGMREKVHHRLRELKRKY